MTTEEIIAWKKNFPNTFEKARSKANRRYPSILEIDDDAEFGEYDINEAKREVFIEGYLEAEKDLALSIDDIKKIHVFLYAVKNNKHGVVFTFTRLSDEQYKEVLQRFKNLKNK